MKIGDKRFIKSIRIRNLLSFGPDTEEFEMKSLNVLIGANASGKSNFIEAIKLLQSLPKSITENVLDAGGIEELLWKGIEPPPTAEINTLLEYNPGRGFAHNISFSARNSRFDLRGESIFFVYSDWAIKQNALDSDERKEFVYIYELGGEPRFKGISPARGGQLSGEGINPLLSGDRPVLYQYGNLINRISPLSPQDTEKEHIFNVNQSILNQHDYLFNKGKQSANEIRLLESLFSDIKIYKDLNTGKDSKIRDPQKADEIGDFLFEDASNFALVLNNLQNHPEQMLKIKNHLKDFAASFEDLYTHVDSGTVQVRFYEKCMKRPISALRISDGTMRFLCLLSVLCHPTPPRLICMEEPEIGLHPDVIPLIADLLVEASHRTQLVVTTHSDILIDALTENPEAVVVCEKGDGGTELKRLVPDDLKDWLEDYRLGQHWLKGGMGGTRW